MLCVHIPPCVLYFARGDYMAYTEQGYQASKKYKAGKIKRVPLDMQIADYERVKDAADTAGESVNGFIKRAVFDRVEREKETPQR